MPSRITTPSPRCFEPVKCGSVSRPQSADLWYAASLRARSLTIFCASVRSARSLSVPEEKATTAARSQLPISTRPARRLLHELLAPGRLADLEQRLRSSAPIVVDHAPGSPSWRSARRTSPRQSQPMAT